jgi:hypothetical protein
MCLDASAAMYGCIQILVWVHRYACTGQAKRGYGCTRPMACGCPRRDMGASERGVRMAQAAVWLAPTACRIQPRRMLEPSIPGLGYSQGKPLSHPYPRMRASKVNDGCICDEAWMPPKRRSLHRVPVHRSPPSMSWIGARHTTGAPVTPHGCLLVVAVAHDRAYPSSSSLYLPVRRTPCSNRPSRGTSSRFPLRVHFQPFATASTTLS